jgi:hypothetical protein
MTDCDAKIRPMTDDTEVVCEKGSDPHTTHDGQLRDYAYPGSVTKLSWQDDDRRTFRGDWAPCTDSPGCILPARHRGRHAV